MEEWREVIESDRRMLQKTMFVAKVAFELPWGRLAGKSWGSEALLFFLLLAHHGHHITAKKMISIMT